MATLEEILNKAAATAVTAATSWSDVAPIVAQRLDQETALPPKILTIGDFATGKTEFLLGPILAGERLWVIETDNGSGLATIRAMLDPSFGNPRCLNRPDLLKNIYVVTIPSYAHLMRLFREPLSFFPDLAAFDPTVSVWEGLTNFQSNYIDMEILKKEGEDPTQASLTEDDRWEYYRKLKRATIRALDRFLVLPGPRGPLPKIVTVLRNTDTRKEPQGKSMRTVQRVDTLTGEARPAALIQGAAEALLMPAFDVVLATNKETPVSNDPLDKTVYPVKYTYQFVKNRYGNTPDVMDADPSVVWNKLTNRKGDK